MTEAALKNPRLWPPFPGFDIAFDCKFPDKEVRSAEIDELALLQASRVNDANRRAFAVVDFYLSGIKDLRTRSDEQLNVIVCIVPEQIWHNCRPKSILFEGTGEEVTLKQRKLRVHGQQDLFRDVDSEPYQFAVDFRRQLKARAMTLGIPLQLVRESTLRTNDTFEVGQRVLTPLSDRAWNIATALYYKAGGQPWRLSTARDGVCYVGLVYKRTDPIHGDRTACCAAQMFLETGDGIVLRSDFGPWYSPETKQFHLTAQEARKLLSKVLTTYDSVGGKRLREVFLHYRASISSEEFLAFRSACPSDVKLVAIRVAADRYGVHLYREGTRPVIRGSFWKINEHMGYLWSSGFKPRLATYDGMETPVPLRIEIQHGEADIMQVATDILGLTKLNYNECKYGDSAPVTIGFSESVGEILVSNPSVKNPNPRFKFYI